MPGITFSGLASGLDTDSIISQLVAIERLPIQDIQRNKSDSDRHGAIIADLKSRLSTLDSVLDGFDTPDEIAVYTSSSSDETAIGVTSSGAAFPGSYAVRVEQLARGETTVSNQFGSETPGFGGSFDITVGAGSPVTVNYSSSDTLNNIANAINDSGAEVNASVVYDGVSSYQLMVTSQGTGSDSAITFNETSGTLGLATPANELVGARNSRISLNGITIERGTNTLSDVLEGLTLTLEKETAVGDPDIVVEVEKDNAGQRDKVNEFVDAYNGIIGILNTQLGYSGTTKGSDTLFGDSTLRSLQNAMGQLVTSSYAHDGGTISAGLLGIELDNTGLLSINSTKFDDFSDSDSEAIESLFAGTGGADGLAKVLQDMVDTYVRSGDGALTVKEESISSLQGIYDEQIESIENRAQNLNDRLVRQFTALEQTMAGLQAQQSSLASVFG